MLIDDFLPIYHVMERHAVDIQAPMERVWGSVYKLNLGASRVIRWLVHLRYLPARILSRTRLEENPSLTLEGLLKAGFILLGERPHEELVLGLVGRFWKLAGEPPLRLDASDFRQFDRPGYAKVAWNFFLQPQSDGKIRLVTETRIYCTDMASRQRFHRYWFLVGPFSGLLRKELLRGIQRDAQRDIHS